MAETMKAWRTHAYGEPGVALKLDTVDIPEPGADQGAGHSAQPQRPGAYSGRQHDG